MMRPFGKETILEAKNLEKRFPILSGLIKRKTSAVRAVDSVSFEVPVGEVIGLVGESGCGKSTLARLLLRLIEPSGGQVIFEGQDLLALSREEMRKVRRDLQIVFQDPSDCINPRMNVLEIISEPLAVHGYSKQDRLNRVQELMELVGLGRDDIYRHPHSFSGGQKQRIVIARALALSPKLVVCDEPVSALDVSIQGQILRLLDHIREKMNLTYIFISHDLAVIKYVSDQVMVMYLGKIVEKAPAETLFKRPTHPYTQALLSAITMPDPRRKPQRIILQGDVPNPARIPEGCRFHTRCPYARNQCRQEQPELCDVGDNAQVACFFWENLSLQR